MKIPKWLQQKSDGEQDTFVLLTAFVTTCLIVIAAILFNIFYLHRPGGEAKMLPFESIYQNLGKSSTTSK